MPAVRPVTAVVVAVGSATVIGPTSGGLTVMVKSSNAVPPSPGITQVTSIDVAEAMPTVGGAGTSGANAKTGVVLSMTMAVALKMMVRILLIPLTT